MTIGELVSIVLNFINRLSSISCVKNKHAQIVNNKNIKVEYNFYVTKHDYYLDKKFGAFLKERSE